MESGELAKRGSPSQHLEAVEWRPEAGDFFLNNNLAAQFIGGSASLFNSALPCQEELHLQSVLGTVKPVTFTASLPTQEAAAPGSP